MRVDPADLAKRDNLALRIRHDWPVWYVLEKVDAVVAGGNSFQSPALYIWPDKSDIREKTGIVVRFLWNAATVEAPGIAYTVTPFATVSDGMMIAVQDCVMRLVAAKIIKPVMSTS